MGLTLYKYFTIFFCTKYRKKNKENLKMIMRLNSKKNIKKSKGGYSSISTGFLTHIILSPSLAR